MWRCLVKKLHDILNELCNRIIVGLYDVRLLRDDVSKDNKS
jgi:hypothetical protein